MVDYYFYIYIIKIIILAKNIILSVLGFRNNMEKT